MASTDWWTQSTSTQSFHTPQRPSSVPQLGASSRPTARFVGDELDPRDAEMAEGIKFIPSFASSPAGKLALGTSPVGTGSPPQVRRSPTSISSPRNARSTRPTPSMAMDEDAPPTSSLRDISAPAPSTSTVMRSSSSLPSAQTPISTSSSSSFPSPPGLIPAANTTALHVFGPPMDQLSLLGPYFDQIGSVSSYTPGPEGSNWFIVTFHSPTSALYALRRHGEIINGRWMLGIKVAGPGSTAGCTLVEGDNAPQDLSNGIGELTRAGPGTPFRIQQTAVLKTKPAVVKAQKGETYAWDESEQSTGIVNKAAEWLFGR